MRFTILQSSLLFLMDVLTFIFQKSLWDVLRASRASRPPLHANEPVPGSVLFVPERNPSLTQVVRGHLNFYLVAGQDLDVVHAHLA